MPAAAVGARRVKRPPPAPMERRRRRCGDGLLLPAELEARVLRALPWLERVRAERVCRGWLKLLRGAPEHGEVDTRAALGACRAAGLPVRAAERVNFAARVAAALALRTGGALRTLAVAGDDELRELLPCLAREQPLLTSMRVCNVSAPTLNAALDVLAGAAAARALPARLDARVSLRASDVSPWDASAGDALRTHAHALLARTVAAERSLLICLDPSFLEEDEELDVNAVYNALVASRRECMDESEEEN